MFHVHFYQQLVHCVSAVHCHELPLPFVLHPVFWYWQQTAEFVYPCTVLNLFLWLNILSSLPFFVIIY